MRKTIRFALLLGASFASLAFAGSALASFSPKLIVTSATPQAAGGGGAVRVGAIVGATDDPTAKTSIYIPTGYQVNTTSAVGTKLGDVTATAAAADLGGAVLPLTGELDVAAPDATAAAQCGTTDVQMWNLKLTAAGQTLNVPMHLVQTSAPEAASGYTYKLVICLPPPDVPAGTPGRAQFGAKLLSATFAVSAITQPSAAGDFRWTSLWTPYNPGKGTPNAAGSVETQAVRHIPTQAKLTITKKKVIDEQGQAHQREARRGQDGPHARQVQHACDRERCRTRQRRDHDDRSRQEGRRRVRFVLPRLRQVGDSEVDGRGRQRHGQRAHGSARERGS